jgi:hypothetical protein
MYVESSGNEPSKCCFLSNSGISKSFCGLILEIELKNNFSVLCILADYSLNGTDTH